MTTPTQFSVDGFRVSITLDGRIMRFQIVGKVEPDQHSKALAILDRYVAIARPFARDTNVWGCDGIGEVIERGNGRAFRYLSTMGPRNYVKALLSIARSERERLDVPSWSSIPTVAD